MWTKYDTQKLLAVGLMVAGWLLFPKDSARPPLEKK
jgi:hypothetical protein